jgi:hypothetical protein
LHQLFYAAELVIIIEYFFSRYGIEQKIEPRRNGQSVLRINVSQTKAFFEIVAPHIPDSMSYKLG